MRTLTLLLGTFLLGTLAAQDAASRSESLASRLFAIRRQNGARDPAAVGELLATLKDASHPVLRAAAAEALATSPDPRVVGALADAVAREPVLKVRLALVAALGATRDARTVDTLLGLLVSQDLRDEAAVALGTIGERRAYEPIARLYPSQQDGEAARRIALALLALDAERAIPLLLQRFRAGGRSHLVSALALRPDPRVREAMLALLDGENVENGENPDLVRDAIAVLGGIGDRHSVDCLLLLWQRDPQARLAIAQAFGRIRDPKVTNFLADALLIEHEHPGTSCHPLRGEIATTLARIGDARVVPRLCDALAREPDPAAKARFVWTLGALGEPRAIATLAQLLEDPTPVGHDLPGTLPGIVPGTVATLAARAMVELRDGKAAVSYQRLAGGPQGERNWLERITLPTMRAWWQEHRDDARFRFPR